VVGDENNLQKILNLVTKLVLQPKLENKQIEAVLGGTISSRMIEQKRNAVLSSALMQYIQYGNKSTYIDRIPAKDLIKISVVGDEYQQNFLLSNTDLTTTVQTAKSYAVKMYYTGQKPLKEVAEILKGNSPIEANIRTAEPEYYQERVAYDKPMIYFLPNEKLQQADVNFYFPIGNDWKNSEKVSFEAFDEYFGGGFSGLVMNEIREKRSLAYGASGAAQFNPINKTSWFRGWVGSQNDKVMEVLDTYMDLLQNMPLYSDRIDNIKTQIKASNLSLKPSMRSKHMQYELWKKGGWNDDPAKIDMPAIDNLTFDIITNFYNQKIKGKPVVIVIHGDPKQINIKEIQKKYGKVTKLSVSKLFKGSEF
jgi:predicted Zn-dependent peptidase